MYKKNENIAVIGFGSTAATINEPQDYYPEDFLPNARSTICFGIPIPDAEYQTPYHAPDFVCRAPSLKYHRPESLAVQYSSLFEESELPYLRRRVSRE